MRLAAGQAVTYADAVRLSPRLKAHLAASTPALMHAVWHVWSANRLHQSRLLDRSADEGGEERVWRKRPRFQLGMELHADEPGMVRHLDDLREEPVGQEP